MNAISGTLDARARSSAWPAIVYGGVLSGAIDLGYAFLFFGAIAGVTPVRILQSIASGLLGTDAFAGGWPAAALGFVAHFTILIVAAAMYYAASLRIGVLVRRWIVCGFAFGAAIYATMNFIVVPLSAAPHFRSSAIQVAANLTVHVLLLGPAISFCIRRYSVRSAA